MATSALGEARSHTEPYQGSTVPVGPVGLGVWPRNPGLGVNNGPARYHGAAVSCLIPKGPISCAESH